MARRKNDYFIYGDMVSVMECSFDKSLKDFYARLPYIENITHRHNMLHLHLEWGSNYYQYIGFDKVEYRDRNGNIVTLTSNMRHDNSYGAMDTTSYYTQTEIPYPNEYGIYDVDEPYNVAGIVNLYDLVMNKINRDNPYLHIHTKGQKGTTAEEIYYWGQRGWDKANQFVRGRSTHELHVLDSTGQPAVAYMHGIIITFKSPIYKSMQASVDSTNKTYSFLPICESGSMDDYDIKVTNINYDGNGSNKDRFTMEGRASGTATVIPFSNFINGLNRVTFTLYNYDTTVEKTFEFYHYQPTISGLKAVNESDLGNNLIDNTTNVTWTSTNQNNADVYINGAKYTSVGSSNACVIPKGKLKIGENTIKVVINHTQPSITGSITAQAETRIKCTRLLPSVSNIAINNNNIDNDITVSWNSIRQSKFRILTGNNSVIASGTTATSYTIPRGTLNVNTSTLKVEVTYNSGFDSISETGELDVSLTCNTPIIYNLEPSNLNRNVDDVVIATFATNEFCDRWVLTANNNQVSNGTTERKVAYGANTFHKGNNTLELTIYYTPTWKNAPTRSVTKLVTFTGYGKPQAPIINNNEIYYSSTPVIDWKQTDEQVAYEYIVLDSTDTQIDSDLVITTVPSVQLSNLSEDDYTLKLRIKNKYNLYSEWVEIKFNVTFSDILIPTFYLIEESNSVQITIFGEQESTFKSISIYRKDNITKKWIEIADNCNTEDKIIDYTCPCNVELEYKLRVYNTSNAYKDSETKTIKVSLINYWLNNIEDLQQAYRMDFVSSSIKFNKDIVQKIYTKQKAPRVFKGTTDYRTHELEVEFSNQNYFEFINFVENANDYNIFCYRNWKGEKQFVQAIVNSANSVNSQVMKVSLTLTEINFHETKMYSGSGFRKIVYLNGEYALDGSIDMSGYDDNYVIQGV